MILCRKLSATSNLCTNPPCRPEGLCANLWTRPPAVDKILMHLPSTFFLCWCAAAAAFTGDNGTQLWRIPTEASDPLRTRAARAALAKRYTLLSKAHSAKDGFLAWRCLAASFELDRSDDGVLKELALGYASRERWQLAMPLVEEAAQAVISDAKAAGDDTDG